MLLVQVFVWSKQANKVDNMEFKICGWVILMSNKKIRKKLPRRDRACKRKCFAYSDDKNSVNHCCMRQIPSIPQEERRLKVYHDYFYNLQGRAL